MERNTSAPVFQAYVLPLTRILTQVHEVIKRDIRIARCVWRIVTGEKRRRRMAIHCVFISAGLAGDMPSQAAPPLNREVSLPGH
ncbi:hypothetical protein AQI95_40850 [Streptomyces yokosukanensis]|uniref:Uncharacterized protein n=1 Tax=Streptomyces yokosukanensis TaxID=67386 RepID=A0A101NTT2_9ACTN|nr:hypothetical protein [Streptomyces yokosukanensis]KUM99136.1 hypothetical protein AQI95_40850 [Streptomyces yokosukanensis]